MGFKTILEVIICGRFWRILWRILWQEAQNPLENQGGYEVLRAVRTGLEPATHGVTGRYSNQLNYRTIFSLSGWYSNPGNPGNYRTIFSLSGRYSNPGNPGNYRTIFSLSGRHSNPGNPGNYRTIFNALQK